VQWVAANGVLFVDSRPGNTRDRSPSSPESAAGAAQRTLPGIRGEENMEERKVERQRHHLNFPYGLSKQGFPEKSSSRYAIPLRSDGKPSFKTSPQTRMIFCTV